ncbi:tetratricopeptide repeat protein [Salinimicrobium xinjiangense]|uniref:tetratricopeptide repeat protein n=1 Tax=Salinimicrobium xinjiangense TaxID=438596 RepID=UPI000415829B|nr:tetratricopeptide repeat protein [Salinimicrobium xinjiangense]
MKKTLYIVPFLTLLFAGNPASAQVPEKPVVEMAGDSLGNVTDAFQEKFFEALKQKAIENYDRAIDALVQALAFNSEEPVVYLELGKNYNALQKYAEAAAYLERGRKAAPGNAAMLEELYTTYYQNKEFDRALPVVKELAKINTAFSEDLVNLYIQNEQFEAALSLLDSLDKTKGSSTYRESLRRQVYARTNNVEAQISDLKENIGENPQDEKDYLNLIFVYSESGQVDKAFETAQQLLEINPDSELVHLALYKFYMTKDDSAEAVNSMDVLLGSDQIDEVTKYQALNDFLIYVTENPSLEEDLIRLVKVFSEKENNQKVYKQLGTFFLEKGNPEVALDYFNTALKNEKNDFGLFREVITLEAEAGNYEQVKVLSERALEIFPAQSWLFLMLGTAQNSSGEFKKAEDNLLMGLDYLIEDPELERKFYRQLAESYKGLSEPQKASEALKKAENNKQ